MVDHRGVAGGDRGREPLPESTAVQADREEAGDAECAEERADLRESFEDAHRPKYRRHSPARDVGGPIFPVELAARPNGAAIAARDPARGEARQTRASARKAPRKAPRAEREPDETNWQRPTRRFCSRGRARFATGDCHAMMRPRVCAPSQATVSPAARRAAVAGAPTGSLRARAGASRRARSVLAATRRRSPRPLRARRSARGRRPRAMGRAPGRPLCRGFGG